MHKIIFRFLAWFLLVSLSSQATAADPGRITVFQHDTENGYGFRIPALVAAADGSLLAFAERRAGLHDHAENDIVLRRSTDNGKTWLPMQVLADEGRDSLNDPCAVVLQSGRVLLMYQRFPWLVHARTSSRTQRGDPGYDGPRNTRTCLIHSDDNGISWSSPREITKMVRGSDRISIGSPGAGIQLARGEHKGRIILPLYETRPLPGNERDWLNSVAYSDDQGETWKVSNNIPHRGHTGFGNEAQVVELNDGRILMIARNEGGFHRKYSVSRDGGIHWSNMKVDYSLPGTACQGSVHRHRWLDDGDGIIAFSAPANKYGRNQGTVRLSLDDGEEWVYSRVIEPGFFAYSCLASLADGNIALLYETDNYRKIVFTSFSEEWVKAGDTGKTRKPYFSIPLVDLDQDRERQVVVDK